MEIKKLSDDEVPCLLTNEYLIRKEREQENKHLRAINEGTFLGTSPPYFPSPSSIASGLGLHPDSFAIAGSGVMPEIYLQPGSGNLSDVIPGWRPQCSG